jgi:eukaryotic-like serine/threonine-protein kinase
VPFVVMELVEGPTLAERLTRGPVPWRTAVRIAADVAAGLAAAHARGLVHRDIKPANVILTASGAKVVDFGIAAVAGDRTDGAGVGLLLGTPAYVAPERFAGEPVTAATDVYALGVLLYRALAGALPWEADTPTGLIRAHQSRPPDPLPAIDGLPPSVAELCGRCLSKLPDDRPSSAELAIALRAAATASSPVQPETADDGPTVDDGLTTILSTGMLAAPTQASGRRAGRTRRVPGRRTSLAAAAGVLLAGLVLGQFLQASGGQQGHRVATAAEGVRPGGANPGGANPATSPSCAVDYLTRRDVDGGFAVDLALVNTGDRPVSAWALRFTFPGDQRVVDGNGASWSQDGGTVTVRPNGDEVSLPPGGQQVFTFTGAYRDGNPLPTTFTLDTTACAARLAGATSTTTGNATTVGGTGNDSARPAAGARSDDGNANAGHGNGKRKKPKD